MQGNKKISLLDKEYINSLASEGLRLDGRKYDEHRNIVVNTGMITSAQGSAEVKLGNTRVLVGVKINQGDPYEDNDTKGVLITSAEIRPMICATHHNPNFKEMSVELARVVDRGIREGECIDLDTMSKNDVGKIWIVFVDIHVIEYDGNIIDAAGIGAAFALEDAARNISGDSFPIEVNCIPIPTTFTKIGNSLFIDPCKIEEEASKTRLTITTIDNGNIVAMQKSGNGSFYVEDIIKCMETSQRISAKLRAIPRKG